MAFTTLPTILAGDVLTGDDVQSILTCISELRPITAAKASTTSRNTTTSRTADPDLVLALPASSTWDFQFTLYLSSAANAAGDFSGELQFPSGATLSAAPHGLDIAIASGFLANLAAGSAEVLDSSSPTADFWHGCSTTPTMMLIIGRITLDTTAGNLTLAWAQQSSNANNTNLLGGSFATARRWMT